MRDLALLLALLFAGAVPAAADPPLVGTSPTPQLSTKPGCSTSSSYTSGKPNAQTQDVDGSTCVDAPALGARDDAAWSGSGSGSIVAVLKAIWGQLSSLASAVSGGQLQTTARPDGGNGTDFSANVETVTFGSGPSYTPAIATYSVVATLPATASRAGCQIMNRSANTLLEVWDDGAGNSATVFSLASGGSAGAQGGADNCNGFKGRITVMSTSSSDTVAVRQW